MRIGIIGDVHEPFTHPMYMRFCYDTFIHNRVDRIVFIGDIVDLHALSFHEHDADGRSAGDEIALATKETRKWHKCFPRAKVCIGNHDERWFRVARKNGIPLRCLKSYNEVLDTPTWSWDYDHNIEGVRYTHGTATSGVNAARNLAIASRMSVVIGHIHGNGGYGYQTNRWSRIFYMSVGCGIDTEAYAMAYGRHFPVRPVLGCGVVVDGEEPIFKVMKIGRGETYHHSRAPKRAYVKQYRKR